MAPIAKERQPCLRLETQKAEPDTAPLFSGESIVISGMSGTFPMSNNIVDFSKILYNKVNPVNCDDVRWKEKHPEVSEYTGKVPDLDRFDSQFFMVHKRLGQAMDPMARKVLEHSYQAIYDSGLSPKHLNGKKVGVYIASSFSDSEKYGVLECISKTGYGITGVSKTMFANRISYWLNAKGPSINLDNADCGYIVALEEAIRAVASGNIESAIVGGVNLCLTHYSLVHYNRCIKLSRDGTTKSFDQNADGCTKSDAISVLFIQKAKDALRAYAEVVHIKNEFISSFGEENGQSFGFIRNPDKSATFLKNFYTEARFSPNDVEYIEACGSATPEADKAELQSIEKVFCSNRSEPLLVGSVISNIGLCDAASGATAITKVLLGYHHGLIASNLHCETPRQDIPAIQDGRMCIVTDHRPFRGTYAAVNCLSFTGVNSHLLLRSCSKPKDTSRYATSMPRLVTISTRQKKYLKDIFDSLKEKPIDVEEIALFNNIHSNNISGHLGRGYIILDTNEDQKTVCLSQSIEHSDEMTRPLWYVYSGMGSQWAGMGAQLMRIPIFAAAIERCHKILEPRGIDIVNVITSSDKTIFDNVLNSFVGIAAIQIGITDILTALGLRPDKIIGHSVGELGCAYADGCLTSEEMIMTACSRGKASNEASLIRGAMAAVGLGYQQLSKFCPPSIDIACHNSSTSSTISGPEEHIREFVAMLTAKGVFAKEVPSANIAYHSRYIANAGPYLLELLAEVIKEPKVRSERWLSSSVPQESWNEPIAKHCSAEYLTNNLLNPVLFEETSNLVPSNAVLVEIAPHGLLQAILKRSLPTSCKNIPLTQRGHKDNAQFLLDAIGKLYVEGYNLQIQAIYPKVEFPVSTGTNHLSHRVKWNHTDSWSILQAYTSTKLASSSTAIINIHDIEHCYLNGNVVQGNILFPFAGALMVVWDTLAMTLGLDKKRVSVRFHDVHLYAEPILRDQKQLKLNVYLQRGSGRFEALDEDSIVTTGYIEVMEESGHDLRDATNEKCDIDAVEIYENLSSRGYSYSDSFQSIDCVNESLTVAQVKWNENWVTFLDGLLQLNTLRCSHDGVSIPSQVKELTIDIDKHRAYVDKGTSSDKVVMEAKIDEICDFISCGGVVLHHLRIRNLQSFNQTPFQLISPISDKNENIIPSDKFSSETNFTLQIGNIGNLDTLHWEEISPTVVESGINVLVEYAGINMSDVNRASGLTPCDNSETYFGMDFSGYDHHGERVMGLVRNGAASKTASVRPELLWPVPAHWTLEEAATVPLAYTQAYYYLCVKNELQRGWRVLIHGATGALGQAAISIALAHNCKVFATVSDNNKKKFLLKLFPELNENLIGNSRDHSFGDMVLNATNGDGCNIIISCVRDDLKNISLKCTAFSGVTIDMVQMQNRDKFEYGMFNMTKQRSYIAADFYSLFDFEKNKELLMLQKMMSEGIARGDVRPLTSLTFGPHEATRVFRLLAASRHRGRALLRVRDFSASATSRVVCSPRTIHLVVWDGSSLGLQLADRLIIRGAKKLRLVCLNASSQHLLKLRLWKNAGVDVEILSDKLSNINAVTETLRGSIEGIYILITDGNWTGEVGKLTDNLDITSRKFHSLLKYFAVITTADSNEGAQICLMRANAGLPATALKLPARSKTKNTIHSLTESSWNRSAVDVIELALRSKCPVLTAKPLAVDKPSLKKIFPILAESGHDDANLQDLGLGETISFVQYFLKSVYHVSMDDEKLLKLTKKKLLEIEMKAAERTFGEVEKGLCTFYSMKDHDELQVTTDCIPLSTLVVNVDTMVGGIDLSRPHLYIVPGLEGVQTRFQALCEQLKLAALVLQPGLERPHESHRELAIRYSKILIKQFKGKTNFYLLGYEFGIVVALELAAILEDLGLTGTIYCIGDGPDEMKVLLESELSSFDSTIALQEGVVRHVFSLLTNDSAAPLEKALQDCSSWQERVDACVRSLLGRAPQTVQYIRALLEAAYTRVQVARRTIVSPRTLHSQLVLMRVRRDREQDNVCSLQRYSKRPLIVEDLAAPMAHAAEDLRVPAIINKYLDNDLLQNYANSNLCHSYINIQ